MNRDQLLLERIRLRELKKRRRRFYMPTDAATRFAAISIRSSYERRRGR